MSFRRELGRFDTAMVVVGGIIGAGIFINPYIVERRALPRTSGAAAPEVFDNPVRSGAGFALFALGVPAYMFWSRQSKEAPVAGAEAAPPDTGSVDG